MRRTKPVQTALVAGFVLFVIGAVRERIDPIAAARHGGLISRAEAAASACDVPRIEELERNWTVVSTSCTSPCKQTHLEVGDKLKFAKDISGAANFSLDVAPAAVSRRAARTEGYALSSDGVGNVVGPIVFQNNPLDGTPLQTHWLIVKLRKYDADGLGMCKLHGRIAVCDEQPAAGATACTALQHAGEIHIEP